MASKLSPVHPGQVLFDEFPEPAALRQYPLAENTGKSISPHALRHAAITADQDAGCSLRDVQDDA